jgi:phosphatidylserine decarboxylase
MCHTIEATFSLPLMCCGDLLSENVRTIEMKKKFCIYHYMPTRFLSGVFGAVMACRWRWFKSIAINIYMRLYQITLEEAVISDRKDYESLDDFFTRCLKPEARPISKKEKVMLSPVDGSLSALGKINEGRCLQVKGIPYTVSELIGGDEFLAEHYRGGVYANFYLSPKDYHRVHLPVAGELVHMTYIPGPLLPVKPALMGSISGVLAGNERLVCEFVTAHGSMLLVMVGALFVGGIEVSWHQQIINREHGKEIKNWNYNNDRIAFDIGDEVGCFHMGSAVVIICNYPQINWEESLHAGSTVKMGEAIASYGEDETRS